MNSSQHLAETKQPTVSAAREHRKKVPLMRDLRIKIGAGAVVGAVCSAMYQFLQNTPSRTAQLRIDCWSWQLMPFSEIWTWPYFSMFLIIGFAWLSLPDRRSIRQFSTIFLSTASIAWICFCFWPTSCLRPSIATPSLPYQILIFFDGPTNCLPCLHSAFTILSTVVLYRRTSQMQHITALRTLLIIWVILINLSIVGLRQHIGIDIAAGLLLGGGAGWIYSSRDAGTD
jgi:hypothetical protein